MRRHDTHYIYAISDGFPGWGCKEFDVWSREYRSVIPVARDAMAALLYRLAGSPALTAPTTSPFTDVDVSNQFSKEITWLHTTGIATGWPQTDGTTQFRPLATIARDAVAAFMNRLENHLTHD